MSSLEGVRAVAVVPDKYRGTEQYRLARNELIRIASSGREVYYMDLALVMGLRKADQKMNQNIAQEVSHAASEISEDEHLQDRPMLSAVLIREREKDPGKGFFDLAKNLGRLGNDPSENGKRRFWEKEKVNVYATWKRE